MFKMTDYVMYPEINITNNLSHIEKKDKELFDNHNNNPNINVEKFKKWHNIINIGFDTLMKRKDQDICLDLELLHNNQKDLDDIIIGLLAWELEIEFRKERYASNERLENESESHYLLIGNKLKQYNDLKNDYFDYCLHELLFLKVLGPNTYFKKKDKPLVDSLYNKMKNKVIDLFMDTYFDCTLNSNELHRY